MATNAVIRTVRAGAEAPVTISMIVSLAPVETYVGMDIPFSDSFIVI